MWAVVFQLRSSVIVVVKLTHLQENIISKMDVSKMLVFYSCFYSKKKFLQHKRKIGATLPSLLFAGGLFHFGQANSTHLPVSAGKSFSSVKLRTPCWTDLWHFFYENLLKIIFNKNQFFTESSLCLSVRLHFLFFLCGNCLFNKICVYIYNNNNNVPFLHTMSSFLLL